MIDFKLLSARKELFARVTGVKLAEFLKIVEKVRPLWDKMLAKKKCHGRNSNLKILENEILMAILYYRYYTSHYFLGMQFNLDASNVCRHIQRLEPLLASAVSLNKERNFSEKDLQILIDATEIQTQRPSKNQKKFYSGKKKKHTQKVEIMTDLNGKILCISKGYPGRTHDFKVRKQSSKIPKNVTVLADSGYQGLQKIHENTVLPFKRRRKCPLTAEQKAHNSALSSKRVVIEHTFAQLKKFKILGSVYRNFQKKLHLRFNIIAGVYNLRFA